MGTILLQWEKCVWHNKRHSLDGCHPRIAVERRGLAGAPAPCEDAAAAIHLAAVLERLAELNRERAFALRSLQKLRRNREVAAREPIYETFHQAD